MKHILRRVGALTLALMMILSLSISAEALTAEQFLTLLKQYYIQDVTVEVSSQTTVEGMVKALNDPYTTYMNAEQYQALLASMQDDKVVGIGISAAQDEKGLLILGIYDNSPAKELGLTPGDIITQVDGKTTAGQTADTIVGWIKGEEGTTVKLQVLHANGTTQDYTATRKQVVIPATTVQMVDGSVGYIICNTFGSETLDHFLDGMKQEGKACYWVVDLRSNGGGDVNAATQVLGVFLGQGTMVYLQDGSGDYYRYVSQQDEETMYPVVVLTSPETASAAEIFSGTIRDKEGGIIIGSTTYGKGVAQVLLDGSEYPDYFKDGDAVKITAFRYYTTSGSTADQIGIIPNLLVNPEDASAIALLFNAAEPGNDNGRYLRIHMGGWRWYVDLDTATSAENAPYFTEMLEAISPTYKLYQGDGSGGWNETTAAEVAAACQLKDYQPRTFSDVKGSEYETAVNTLCTYGILKGCGDSQFHPGDSLTRAELCALLDQALTLPKSSGASTFSDVTASAWYEDCVNAVAKDGWIEGVGDGTFDPNGLVTNEQLIAILGRLGADLNAYLAETIKSGMPTDNTVPAAYSDWAKPWVWLLSESQKNLLGQKINLLYDDPASLDPTAPASRADAAELMYSVLSYIGILPN